MVRQQEIREHVTRLLDSEQFVTSRSITKLLTFCVDAALAGDEETLKETTVGVFCFGRAPGYDTKRDPIVRVTARRLRSKLELFYENEGSNDELRIVLPKGTYVPRFHYKTNQTVISKPSSEEQTVISDPLPIAEPISGHNYPFEIQLSMITKSHWLRPAAWTFLILLLITSVIILTHNHLRQDVEVIAPPGSPSHSSSLATEDLNMESGVSRVEKQTQMRRQFIGAFATSGTPKTTGSPEQVRPTPNTASADDIVASVEPRL